jgi:hypothetical protein
MHRSSFDPTTAILYLGIRGREHIFWAIIDGGDTKYLLNIEGKQSLPF